MTADERIRVAWLFPSLRRGNYMFSVLREFTRFYKDTRIFTGLLGDVDPRRLRLEGLDISVVGRTRIWTRTMKRGYLSRGLSLPPLVGFRHIIRYRPRVCFSSAFTLWTLMAVLMKSTMNWRVIVLYDGSSPIADAANSLWRIKLRRAIVRHSDAFVTNSLRGGDYLTTSLGAPSARVQVHPYQVPDRELLSAKSSKVDVSFSLVRPTFLYVGRLATEKGIEVLLGACSILQAEGYSKWSLLLVGDGPLMPRVESYVHKNDLRGILVTTGWVEYGKLASYYERSDVFVFPSLSDVWGVAVLEAMLYGLPVICSTAAGVAEVVEHGVTGSAVEPNPQTIAHEMRRFLDDPALGPSMGRRAQGAVGHLTPANAAAGLAQAVRFVDRLR